MSVINGDLGTKKLIYRVANNGRSTDNVRSELGIDRTNPWDILSDPLLTRSEKY